MAEENTEELFDKKALKAKQKAEKAEMKKARKESRKAGDDSLDSEVESSIGGKIAVFFVTIIIFLIWLAIIVLLVKWDVGGFGSGVLAPVIKDVPYLNQILPDSVMEELSTEDSAYAFNSLEDAIAQIKVLEIELAEAHNQSTENSTYIADLEAKAAELEIYKQNEAAFEEEREKWYEEVVFSEEAPDIINYREYYESIDPANAEVLYKQVVEQTQYTEEVEDYVRTYSSMKPKEAAAIFDTMTSDLQLVSDILMNMDAQSRADILGKMNADTAARVTEIMEPSE